MERASRRCARTTPSATKLRQTQADVFNKDGEAEGDAGGMAAVTAALEGVLVADAQSLMHYLEAPYHLEYPKFPCP